ncbi:hypothetical protein H0H81_000550 [Sphagnurus paluster]|uniref:Uncharacterized protein n=1 Tax=Sphagnurus paluster TaxID=117069 RepID=A0A9P7FTG8_9AGAR|nr:hypothetical protein H0H81_000550 [Sphagnurus paluster]
MRLAGVIYLHDITQTRTLGTAKKNLDMFQKLCGGRRATRNTVLLTTKWGIIKKDVGIAREKQLKNHWKEMCEGGSWMARWNPPEDDEHKILMSIIRRHIPACGALGTQRRLGNKFENHASGELLTSQDSEDEWIIKDLLFHLKREAQMAEEKHALLLGTQVAKVRDLKKQLTEFAKQVFGLQVKLRVTQEKHILECQQLQKKLENGQQKIQELQKENSLSQTTQELLRQQLHEVTAKLDEAQAQLLDKKASDAETSNIKKESNSSTSLQGSLHTFPVQHLPGALEGATIPPLSSCLLQGMLRLGGAQKMSIVPYTDSG